MTPSSASPLPSIQRYRPIDATGWFWSFVLVLMGLFYGGIYSPVFGSFFILGAFCCFFWQFKKWSIDSSINRLATQWCHTHYPAYGDTSIVDLIVAMGHDTRFYFDQVSPSSALDDLNRSDDGEIRLFLDDRDLLKHVVREARIRHVICSGFSGSTVHDAIEFVFKNNSLESK